MPQTFSMPLALTVYLPNSRKLLKKVTLIKCGILWSIGGIVLVNKRLLFLLFSGKLVRVTSSWEENTEYNCTVIPKLYSLSRPQRWLPPRAIALICRHIPLRIKLSPPQSFPQLNLKLCPKACVCILTDKNAHIIIIAFRARRRISGMFRWETSSFLVIIAHDFTTLRDKVAKSLSWEWILRKQTVRMEFD